MKRHRQTEHRGTRNSFLCDQCNYATSQHNSLKRHILAMHGEGATARQEKMTAGANFRCELCSFQARWGRSIRRHRLAVHESGGARMHACRDCPYRAGQAGTLRRHIRLVHGQPKPRGSVPPLATQDAVELAMAYSDIRL